jgi:hypothetical protein
MIDRYDLCNSGSMYNDDHGEWVMYEDAAARIAELEAQAINFRESIRKAALDSEHGHEILDLCWDSYFPEMPVAGVHRFVLSPNQ